MNIRMIDTSHSIPIATLNKIKPEIQVGDRVIMFNSEVTFDKVMTSQSQITGMEFVGGCGTLLAPAIKAASDSKAPIYCYSDGYFSDGYKMTAPDIEGRFKLIDPETL